jgi:hypothetical protein
MGFDTIAFGDYSAAGPVTECFERSEKCIEVTEERIEAIETTAKTV